MEFFSVIFAFCSMFKDACELNVIEISHFVNRCFSLPLLHFLHKPACYCCQQLSGNFPEWCQSLLHQSKWKHFWWHLLHLCHLILTKHLRNMVQCIDLELHSPWQLDTHWLEFSPWRQAYHANLASQWNHLCSDQSCQTPEPAIGQTWLIHWMFPTGGASWWPWSVPFCSTWWWLDPCTATSVTLLHQELLKYNASRLSLANQKKAQSPFSTNRVGLTWWKGGWGAILTQCSGRNIQQ